jgi:hypothetical protein
MIGSQPPPPGKVTQLIWDFLVRERNGGLPPPAFKLALVYQKQLRRGFQGGRSNEGSAANDPAKELVSLKQESMFLLAGVYQLAHK